MSPAPDQMWGTDATACFTETEGNVTIFTGIDHCTAERVAIHAVKKATRFAALEPIRQGVKETSGPFLQAVSDTGNDNGSVYMSDDFQYEIQFLGIEPSAAFVRQTEGKPYASHCTSSVHCVIRCVQPLARV